MAKAVDLDHMGARARLEVYREFLPKTPIFVEGFECSSREGMNQIQQAVCLIERELDLQAGLIFQQGRYGGPYSELLDDELCELRAIRISKMIGRLPILAEDDRQRVKAAVEKAMEVLGPHPLDGMTRYACAVCLENTYSAEIPLGWRTANEKYLCNKCCESVSQFFVEGVK